tara:strand:- start:328 stop:2097 length:1770 start_codon:yes stop_codon:yes gene_type:complete
MSGRGLPGQVRQRTAPAQPGRPKVRGQKRRDIPKVRREGGDERIAENERRLVGERVSNERKQLERIRNNLRAFIADNAVGAFSRRELTLLLEVARGRRKDIDPKAFPFTPDLSEYGGMVKLKREKENKKVENIRAVNKLANDIKPLIQQAQSKLKTDINQPGRLQLLDSKGANFRDFASAIIASNISVGETGKIKLNDARGELKQFGFSDKALDALEGSTKGFKAEEVAGKGFSKEELTYNTIKSFIDRQGELGQQITNLPVRTQGKTFTQQAGGSPDTKTFSFITPETLRQAGLQTAGAPLKSGTLEGTGEPIDPPGQNPVSIIDISNQISNTFGIPELSLVSRQTQAGRQNLIAQPRGGAMREFGGDTAVDLLNIGGQGVALGHSFSKFANPDQIIAPHNINTFGGGVMGRDFIDPMFGSKPIQDLGRIFDVGQDLFQQGKVNLGGNLSRAVITSEGAVVQDASGVLNLSQGGISTPVDMRAGAFQTRTQVSASGAITKTEVQLQTKEKIIGKPKRVSKFVARKTGTTTIPEPSASLSQPNIKRQIKSGRAELKAPQRLMTSFQPLVDYNLPRYGTQFQYDDYKLFP